MYPPRSDLGTGQNVKLDNGEEGNISRILTNSDTHPYGIKVELESGTIGRVTETLD